MVNLTQRRATALLTELLAGYSTTEFQKKLDELHSQQQGDKVQAEAHVGLLQGRADLVLKVQQRVLGAYGFDPMGDGILEMKMAVRQHVNSGDVEIANLSREIRAKLRIPEMRVEEDSHSDFTEFDTPSGTGFFGGQCKNPFDREFASMRVCNNSDDEVSYFNNRGLYNIGALLAGMQIDGIDVKPSARFENVPAIKDGADLGYYRLLYPAVVRDTVLLHGTKVGEIAKDTVVVVKEVWTYNQRVRARVEEPLKGWISLEQVGNGHRYAERVSIDALEQFPISKKIIEIDDDDDFVRPVESDEPESESEPRFKRV